MREIKFRAWDEENKIWVTNKTSKTDTRLNYDTRFLLKWVNYELMQYTGLKDKNGKEIYEGDIIEKAETNKLKAEVLGSIVFTTEMVAGFKIKEWGFIDKREIEEFGLKIIGNIYENPNLLN